MLLVKNTKQATLFLFRNQPPFIYLNEKNKILIVSDLRRSKFAPQIDPISAIEQKGKVL